MFLLLCLFVFLAPCLGQQYPFIPVGGDDAPKGCLFPFEDSLGRLWLAGCETGTEGLYYFDGNRFHSPLKDGLPNMTVRGMTEDSSGGIWIASSRGIYRVYHDQLEKMVDGQAVAGITRITTDLFLATLADPAEEQPLDHADVVRISKSQSGWKIEVILRSSPQVQFRMDYAGHILYGCDGGFCEFESKDLIGWRPGIDLKIVHHALRLKTSYATEASVIWRDRFGCLWMRGRNDASYQCPGDSDAVTLPAGVVNLGYPLIFELDDGSIVIPSYTKLAIGRPGQFRVLTGLNGFPGAAGVLLGRDGTLFLSSKSLFRFLPRPAMESWSPRDGLDGNAYSILRLGKRLFAAAGDAIFVLSEDRSRWRSVAKVRSVSQLLAGPGNTLLAGSHTEGVVQVQADGTILRRSVPSNVAALARTPDGQFWASGNGISRIAFRGPQLELLPENVSPPQNGMADMKVDSKGNLWVCYGGGLAHREASGWQVFRNNDGLSHVGCDSLAIDSSGDIWCANMNGGFSLIRDAEGPRRIFQHFQNGKDVGTAQTYFFASDHRGWLWRGAPDGIYVADLEQARKGQWLRLDRSDGLPETNANYHSFYEDADGSVWFGAATSIIHMTVPHDFVHPTYSPSVFLTALSWDGGPAQINGEPDRIPSGSDIDAHIGSLQYDRRNALQLRYRLLPDQSAWQLERSLDIRLGKARWGNHTLEVQARLGDGPWSSTVVEPVLTLKPIWLSWPVLLTVTLTGSIAGAIGYYRQKRRRARAEKTFPDLAAWRVAALSSEAGHLEGSVLDSRFAVGRILAQGGFATVSEGRDLEHDNQPCAVKIFRQEWANREWIERRFRQEIKALEQVHHPNVVRIRGHGTTPGGAPYLVMEFIKGKTLREMLEAGSLMPSDIASYLRQIAAALQAIHEQGIFHRDLKPENLMVREAGSRGQEMVLIDFSIAIVKDADATMQGLSRAAGTMYYMAPEQAMGYADASTDIHSLAKIVVEMLTGKRLSELLPGAAMNLAERVRELLRGAAFGLSPSTIDFIGSALEFDPGRRTHDVAAFAAFVAQDLEGADPHPVIPTASVD